MAENDDGLMISPQRARRKGVFPAGILALAAVLLFAGLGDHVLWSDEANTALYARNLLEFGKLTAWDGANLIGFSGKTEFDENLVNTYMPPQQYYVAALGMKLFGSSPLGARLPFALIGLATIALTLWWTRRFFDSGLPLFLPALLLALSPAFLLFMRNSRYYALAAFWAVVLFALWTAFATRRSGSGSEPRDRNRTIAMHFLGALTVAGLFTSQYLTAVAALAVLPVFFLDPRFRSRRQVFFLATLAAAGIVGVLWVLARGPAAESLVEQRGTLTSWLKHAAVLFWWYVRDMGYFEFFAWPVLLPLALPWLLKKAKPARPLALRGALLLAVFLCFLAVISVLSPQGLQDTRTADIRYAIPLLVVGAIIAGISLAILSRLHRALTFAAVIVLLGTNALYVGSHQRQNRHDTYSTFPVRSTLLDYIREIADPYKSGNAIITGALADFPRGSLVWINPFAFTTSSMFDLPQLHFCGQVRDTLKDKSPRLASLPDYVFWSSPLPEVLIILTTEIVVYEDDDGFEIRGVDSFLRERIFQFMATDKYRSREMLPIRDFDDARPEIPFRLFFEPSADKRPRKVAWILVKED